MEEDLGFGAVERCQAVLGVECCECKYFHACIGEDLDDIDVE